MRNRLLCSRISINSAAGYRALHWADAFNGGVTCEDCSRLYYIAAVNKLHPGAVGPVKFFQRLDEILKLGEAPDAG